MALFAAKWVDNDQNTTRKALAEIRFGLDSRGFSRRMQIEWKVHCVVHAVAGRWRLKHARGESLLRWKRFTNRRHIRTAWDCRVTDGLYENFVSHRRFSRPLFHARKRFPRWSFLPLARLSFSIRWVTTRHRHHRRRNRRFEISSRTPYCIKKQKKKPEQMK